MPEQTFREKLDERLTLYLLKNPEASGDDRRIRGFMAGAAAALEIAAEALNKDPALPLYEQPFRYWANSVEAWLMRLATEVRNV